MLSEMSIYPALKALVPNLVLGCVSAVVAVEKHNESLSGPDGLERWLQRAANSFAGVAAVKESKRLVS
jgi:hypothetical protein